VRKRDGRMGEGATGRHETFRLQTAIGGVSCLSLIHMLHPPHGDMDQANPRICLLVGRNSPIRQDTEREEAASTRDNDKKNKYQTLQNAPSFLLLSLIIGLRECFRSANHKLCSSSVD
jgi:hypothetical protein